MKLKTLLRLSGISEIKASLPDLEVQGISASSHKVREGFIFVAIAGPSVDGHKFIPEAIKNGALAVVLQDKQFSELDRPFINVPDSRQALTALVKVFYNDPAKDMKVIGVTGTNGKTTITYLLEAILRQDTKVPAVIGTVNYRYRNMVLESKNTTPGTEDLFSHLSSMRESGVDHLIMEVSSHGLAQGRTAGLNFHSAIFTNLTQDHLDYHRSMEEYFQAKAILFRALGKSAISIINTDDAYGKKLVAFTPGQVFTYGKNSDADYRIGEVSLGRDGAIFSLHFKNNEFKIKTALIGRHNVYNVTAAYAWAHSQGIAGNIIEAALKKFLAVPGRLERVTSRLPLNIFVDYAHTDDALLNVLISLREAFEQSRIIVVFGCGGDRDRRKRPKMGKVASENADFVFLTSDNPRSEDPLEIIRDIQKGIASDNYKVVADRHSAIKEALRLAKTNDVVLLAGKGHEHYQIIKDKTIHFDDREVALECLQSMN